jgi:2-phosphosulfolactate phosphatase
MKVGVGLSPGAPVAARLGIVIDVLRATTTICQALASGYDEVVCVGEIDDARALAGPGVELAGERGNVIIDGFDHGNSPRELLGDHSGARLVLTTTNGTRALLTTADRCEAVLVASLSNLAAVIEAARGADEVAIVCAGVEGGFAIDDAYVAGRIAAELDGEPDDAAKAAIRLAGSFPSALEGIGGGVSAENIRRAGLEEDISYCARESVLGLVPRIVERKFGLVVIGADPDATII